MGKARLSNIPDEVLAIAEDIREMRIRGAGRIARAAAKAMKIAAEKYSGVNVDDFLSFMENVSKLLLSTRPTAVSLPNAVSYVMRRLKSAKATSVDYLRKVVIEAADEFIQMSNIAVETIGEIGSRLIEDGDVVLTHCHSTAVVSVLKKAKDKGREFKVYADETRPRFQGRITYRDLSSYGIDVTLIPDSAVASVMRKVDKVFVGADAIASNGAVVNKIGTSQVALVAYKYSVPFYVAAETYKFSPMTLIGELIVIEERSPAEIVSREWLDKHPNIRVFNPVFDVTPPEYITAIITEIGIIPPHTASLILTEVFGAKSYGVEEKPVEESEQV